MPPEQGLGAIPVPLISHPHRWGPTPMGARLWDKDVPHPSPSPSQKVHPKTGTPTASGPLYGAGGQGEPRGVSPHVPLFPGPLSLGVTGMLIPLVPLVPLVPPVPCPLGSLGCSFSRPPGPHGTSHVQRVTLRTRGWHLSPLPPQPHITPSHPSHTTMEHLGHTAAPRRHAAQRGPHAHGGVAVSPPRVSCYGVSSGTGGVPGAACVGQGDHEGQSQDNRVEVPTWHSSPMARDGRWGAGQHGAVCGGPTPPSLNLSPQCPHSCSACERTPPSPWEPRVPVPTPVTGFGDVNIYINIYIYICVDLVYKLKGWSLCAFGNQPSWATVG